MLNLKASLQISSDPLTHLRTTPETLTEFDPSEISVLEENHEESVSDENKLQ